MNDNTKTNDVKKLLYVLANTKTEKEIYALLQDLFTNREIHETSQRLLVAQLLNSGKSYAEIEAYTGVSATTIARVSKCMSHGAGGYTAALKLLSNNK